MDNHKEQLGKFFYKNIWEILKSPSDITGNTIITSKISLELAIGLGFIGNSIPIKDIAIDGFSVAGLANKGIKFYQDNAEEQPSIEEYLLIGSRLAYIESCENILRNIVNQTLFTNRISELAVFKEYTNIEDNLDFELKIVESNKLVHCFRETKLAKYFTRNCFSLLKMAGLKISEANILAQRITWNTQRYIDGALITIAGLQTRCVGFRKNLWRKKLTKYQIIDDYLEQYIAKKSQEKIFNEEFTSKDIYVPLKAHTLNREGQTNKKQLPVDLETWAFEILQDPKKQDKVIFIQAEAGRGKTIFCRILADRIRQNLHPIFIPIYIDIKDIKKVGKQFEDTIEAVINKEFYIDDENWLRNKNTRYLFLLDGLDDLLQGDRNSGSLIEFIRQISAFQESCQKSPVELGHRVLVTTRNLVLQSIESNLPTNLERVKILPMDNQIQKQWLNNWSAQVGADSALAFQQFLQHRNCPNIVQELAQEPLLLYLLAAIHRDSELTVEIFEKTSATQAKINIYQQALQWVFPKQKDSGEFIHKSFSDFLSAVHLKTKIEQWIKPGTCTTEFHVPQNIMDLELYDWLGCGGLTPEIIEYLMSLLTQELSLKPSLHARTIFDIPPIPLPPTQLREWEDEGRSLNATSLKNGIKPSKLIYREENGREESGDIFQPVQLFKRLHNFYQRWCEGEFIDTHEQNLPQKKSLQLHWEKIYLGQRQIDIYVGLNVTILLLELHRIAQERDDLKTEIIFNLSAQGNKANSWKFQLLRIINYSNLIHPETFNSIVGQFLISADLSHTDLRGVYLSGANLRGVNFRETYLRGADLSNAYLSGADLSGADLTGVNLRGAHLRGVNLSGANLMGADLSGSDLRGADLGNIDLRGAYLSRSDLRSANLSNMDLRGAQFGGANLNNINLSNANLNGTDLRGAQLNNANLKGAQLSHADLRGVKLSNTDLRGAQLNNANFRGAHLKGTYISNANLSGADLRGARLMKAQLGDKSFGDIHWNKDTKWEGVRGWKTAHNVPECLKQELGFDL